MIRYAANLSMLYADRPVLDRAAAAAADGFRAVESWWPFDTPVPDPAELDAFCDSLRHAGVRLVAVNLDAGETAAGERGLLSDPDLEDRVRDNLEAVATLIERTGCRVVNALYGNRRAGLDPADQDRVAVRRLAAIADRLAPLDAWVVIETLNLRDSPAFPLTDVAVTARLVREVGQASAHGNVGLLLDTYHLATMGADAAAALREHHALVRHVQLGDAPGRGRPGTGRIDFAAVTQALADIRYQGFVGLEYDPHFSPA